MLSAILWIAALAAAVMAIAQLAHQAARLRQDIEDLRGARALETNAFQQRTLARPMFGELYESEPRPFEALATWRGLPLACAAAGLVAIGLLTQQSGASAYRSSDSTVARHLAVARLQYDSLTKTVNAMRDSIAILQQRQRAERNVSTGRPAADAKKRGRAAQGSQGDAPLPSLPTLSGP